MFPNIFYDLSDLIISIALDLTVSLIVIRKLQAANLLSIVTKYALLLFNLFVFLLCYILTRMDLSVGAGLGLFALLGILRIRSEIIKIEELIGLLFLMSLGFIHSVYPQVLELWQLILTDVILLSITTMLSGVAGRIVSVRVKLENLKLLRHGQDHALREVLQTKLGMTVKRITIMNINLGENTAHLQVTIDNRLVADKKVSKVIETRISESLGTFSQNGLKKDFIT